MFVSPNLFYFISFIILNEFKTLVEPHRLFVKEGPLQFISHKGKKRETYYFFAFNDIIIRTKFMKKKNLYEFKDFLSLSRYYLRDVKYNPFMSNSGLYFRDRWLYKKTNSRHRKVLFQAGSAG